MYWRVPQKTQQEVSSCGQCRTTENLILGQHHSVWVDNTRSVWVAFVTDLLTFLLLSLKKQLQ